MFKIFIYSCTNNKIMKKIVFIIFILFSVVSFSQDNEFNIGVNGGITTGNLEDISSSAFGVDANYLFDIFENIKFGPSLNLIYFLTEEFNGVKPDAFIYLPIGGAIRFNSIGEKFYVGADAGYAIGISPSGDNGGIFVKPMLGYHINDKIGLNIFYSGVKKKRPTYGYVGIGVTYNVFGSNNYN